MGAGEHIADAAAQRDQLQPHAAEQLIGQQDGGDEGVRRAAEHRDEAHGGGEPGGQAQQRAECTAEGRTDVEAGDDLAALEARREGQGGQQYLADKVPRQGLPLLHGGSDDAHARAVVAAYAHQVGEGHHGSTAHDGTHPGVWQAAGHFVLHGVEKPAECPGHQRTGNTQHSHQQSRINGKRRCGQLKMGRRDAAGQRDAIGDEGSGEAGDKGHREREAHILHHDAEESRRQRRAEQCREKRRHAAGRGRAAVVVGEAEELCDVVADASAHLQSRALTPGRAAAEVGEHRAEEDGRHQQRADALAAVDGADDGVRPHPFAARHLIKCHDGKTCHRQQPEQPDVLGPPFGDMLHGQVERCADGTADEAGGDGQQQPAGQNGRDGPEGIKLLFQKFFHDNTPVFFISCPQR